jgi:hypothetical protein
MTVSAIQIDPQIREGYLRDAFKLYEIEVSREVFQRPIFRPDMVDSRNRLAVIALIQEGQRIVSLEAEYLNGRGIDKTSQFAEAERKSSFARISQSLLGDPEYKDLVMPYLLDNLAYLERGNFSFLGGGRMETPLGNGPVETFSHFRELLGLGPQARIANLCRNPAGEAWLASEFDAMLFQESDAEGFLMSAIANKDALGIEALMRSATFNAYVSREKAVRIIGKMIQKFPQWKLLPELDTLLKARDNATVIPETKRLIDTSGSSVADFNKAYWADASPLAMSHLIAYALHSKKDPESAKRFLQSCLANDVDLYLGMVEAMGGLGAALDAAGKTVSRCERAIFIIEGFLGMINSGVGAGKIAPVLVAVPDEMLAEHKEASILLLERYRLTGERHLLKLGDLKLRGKILEEELGM